MCMRGAVDVRGRLDVGGFLDLLKRAFQAHQVSFHPRAHNSTMSEPLHTCRGYLGLDL